MKKSLVFFMALAASIVMLTSCGGGGGGGGSSNSSSQAAASSDLAGLWSISSKSASALAAVSPANIDADAIYFDGKGKGGFLKKLGIVLSFSYEAASESGKYTFTFSNGAKETWSCSVSSGGLTLKDSNNKSVSCTKKSNTTASNVTPIKGVIFANNSSGYMENLATGKKFELGKGGVIVDINRKVYPVQSFKETDKFGSSFYMLWETTSNPFCTLSEQEYNTAISQGEYYFSGMGGQKTEGTVLPVEVMIEKTLPYLQ